MSKIKSRERYYQDKYKNFNTYREESFSKLLSAKAADLDKVIQGVASYRILENLAYRQDFQFEFPHCKSRASEN